MNDISHRKKNKRDVGSYLSKPVPFALIILKTSLCSVIYF